MLVKPPLTIGNVVPAMAASTSAIQSGALPTTASIPSIVSASTAWLAPRAVRRNRVRSSQAPSSGPLTMAGMLSPPGGHARMSGGRPS